LGVDAGAFAAQNSTSDFDTAIDIGDDSTGADALAEFGNGNLAFVDAANSRAFSGATGTAATTSGGWLADFMALF
jgi:hypothetical protein